MLLTLWPPDARSCSRHAQEVTSFPAPDVQLPAIVLPSGAASTTWSTSLCSPFQKLGHAHSSIHSFSAQQLQLPDHKHRARHRTTHPLVSTGSTALIWRRISGFRLAVSYRNRQVAPNVSDTASQCHIAPYTHATPSA